MVHADIHDTPQGERIIVTFPFSPSAVNKIKSIDGRKFLNADKGGPAWQFPLEIKVGHELRERFGDELTLGSRITQWGRRENRRHTELRSLATADDAELSVLPEVLPDLHGLIAGDPLPHISDRLAAQRPRRAYQFADIKFMAENSCINANQPGLGKTIEVIGSIFEGQTDDGPQLIITPKTSVRATWEHHLLTWQPHPVLCYTLEGSTKSELDAILEQATTWADAGRPFWFVTNPAQVMMRNEDTGKTDDFGDPIKREVPKIPALFSWTWNNMVVDEYHKMGLTNTKTLTSKAVLKVPRKRTILLSGTPMGGKPIKLFAGLQVVAPETFTSKWRWAGQWLEVEETDYGKKIEGLRQGTEQEFYEHHAPYLLRRTKEEVLPELPPKTIIDVECEMTPTQMKQYKKIAEETELAIDAERLPITSILAMYTRLRQFSNARCEVVKTGGKTKDGLDKIEVRPTFDSGKLPHLLNILEKLGIAGKDAEGTEQVVVFSQFSQTTDMVCKWLESQGIASAKITGATKQADREEIAADFQAGTGARVLCMTTTAGGTSLTLDGYCSTVVFMDETWDPDDQEQGEDRVHRASRMHQVTIYYLRSKNGIEKYIQDLVFGKSETNKAVLDLHRIMKKELSLT